MRGGRGLSFCASGSFNFSQERNVKSEPTGLGEWVLWSNWTFSNRTGAVDVISRKWEILLKFTALNHDPECI